LSERKLPKLKLYLLMQNGNSSNRSANTCANEDKQRIVGDAVQINFKQRAARRVELVAPLFA